MSHGGDHGKGTARNIDRDIVWLMIDVLVDFLHCRMHSGRSEEQPEVDQIEEMATKAGKCLSR